ncbi:hypothetical protein HHI36_006107 [Cryptolaemus montrouzieri]|uniref:Uncharacterized protein n=1 Tax=Cryptolaemus montrouzieri TaxID=559131 RepID=A0ABD2NW94_9CUCU
MEYGLRYDSGTGESLTVYSDADHGEDLSTGRSTTDVVCMYASCAVSWFSQRQASVAISRGRDNCLGSIEIRRTSSTEQLADMLTKPLFKPRLELLRHSVGLINFFNEGVEKYQ